MNFLNKLSEQQIKNIDKIYFLLDHHTFDGDKYVNLIDFNSRSEFILGLVKNLNYQKIKDSIDTIYKNNKGNFNFYLSDDGHKIKLNVDKELGQSKKIVREANKTLPKYVQRKQGFTEDTIKILRKIDDFAKDNNIEIVYFTPTYTDLYIKKMNIKLMLEQRSHFLNFIDGFYDLSYIQGVSNVYEFFHDPAHLNTLGLKKIFEEEFKKDNFINKNNFQRKTKKLRILLD